MIDLQLEGRAAIVTGASRGLGQAAALALAGQAVSVLAAARSLDELKELEKTMPGKILAAQCDMKDSAAVAQLPAQAIDAFGRLDIVVNNAGIAPAGFFLEQSLFGYSGCVGKVSAKKDFVRNVPLSTGQIHCRA